LGLLTDRERKEGAIIIDEFSSNPRKIPLEEFAPRSGKSPDVRRRAAQGAAAAETEDSLYWSRVLEDRNPFVPIVGEGNIHPRRLAEETARRAAADAVHASC
jgi:hypothetical protein